MKPVVDSTIAVVGLGLMGGSLALALKERRVCARIVGIERDAATRGLAHEHGIETTAELGVLADTDVIILATPVRTILEQLARVGKLARAGTLVLDLGSAKREIVCALDALPAHLQVIGGHPMCGKERSGFGVAEAALYANAVFALTPLERTAPETVAFAESLVQSIGARPLVLDAERHDEIVATISHLPYAVAVALMLTASERAQQDAATFALAASGFRDTSRLAGSDVTMMLDILLTNRAPVTRLMRACARKLDALADLVEQESSDAVRDTLQAAMAQRRELFNPKENQHG